MLLRCIARGTDHAEPVARPRSDVSASRRSLGKLLRTAASQNQNVAATPRVHITVERVRSSQTGARPVAPGERSRHAGEVASV